MPALRHRFAVWSAQGSPAGVDRFVYLYGHIQYARSYSTGTTVGSLAFSPEPDMVKHADAQANTPPNIFQLGFPRGTYHIALQIYPYQPGHPNQSGLVTRTARIRLQYPGPGTTTLATATGSIPRSGGLLTASCDYTTADSAGFFITVDLNWAVDTPQSPIYFGNVGGWDLTVEGTRSDI